MSPDSLCKRCRHPRSEHDDEGRVEIPCSWVSLDYQANVRGIHCTCYNFTLVKPEREALSEISRQIDFLIEKIKKISHDGMHTEACRKCAAVSRLRERLSYLGGVE